MGRIAWFDALSRRRYGDLDGFNTLLVAPLQKLLLGTTWMHERIMCDGQEQVGGRWGGSGGGGGGGCEDGANVAVPCMCVHCFCSLLYLRVRVLQAATWLTPPRSTTSPLSRLARS
jgi:hypothetical protein